MTSSSALIYVLECFTELRGTFYFLDYQFTGPPRWRSYKESACQCRKMQEMWVQYPGGKIPWSRNWHATPVLLPGKFHGQRSLAGYSSQGHKESDMTEHTQQSSETASWKRPSGCAVWEGLGAFILSPGMPLSPNLHIFSKPEAL